MPKHHARIVSSAIANCFDAIGCTRQKTYSTTLFVSVRVLARGHAQALLLRTVGGQQQIQR